MKYAMLVLLACSVAGSDNGLLWECDPTILSTEDLCVFKLVDGTLDYEPTKIDLSVGAAEFRKVRNTASGKDLTLAGAPFVHCDKLVASDTEKTGDELEFVRVFEMMAPVRDYAMFAPGELTEVAWTTITKMLTDCNIKMTSSLTGTPAEQYYGTVDVLALMKAPGGVDIHHPVLKYLEESQNELMCIMTSTADWDAMGHCTTYRETHGLAEGQSATCWEAHYATLPNSYDIAYHSTVPLNGCSSSPGTVLVTPTPTDIPTTASPETPVSESSGSDDTALAIILACSIGGVLIVVASVIAFLYVNREPTSSSGGQEEMADRTA